MIVEQTQIRNRIDELKLSFNGYSRQLARPDITGERRQRLESETQLLGEEITTLETLAQLGRVEPDRARIEAEVRSRMAQVRERIAADPDYSGIAEELRDQASGELRALTWALGEDQLTRNARIIMAGHDQADPARTDRAVPAILTHTLADGPNPEARASAAYELGKLHIVSAIPALANALTDEQLVADLAFNALCGFSDEELVAAALPAHVLDQVRTARTSSSG
jgi:hypothetical protein